MLAQSLGRPDVVIVGEPSPFSAPSAWLTARLSRVSHDIDSFWESTNDTSDTLGELVNLGGWFTLEHIR